MKRTLALLSIITAVSATANAQLNMGALQNSHNAANAARHLPTFLGEGSNRLQITLFNPYIYLGSNFVTVEEARNYIEADEITNEMIDNTISKLHPKDNTILACADIALLNVAFNLKNGKGAPMASIGFGVNQRVETSTHFNEELIRFVYRGNKQYAGQTVNLAPRFNGLAFTEYYAGTAINIAPFSNGISIKPAIRISYLAGQASVEMRKDNSISLYTEPEGRYLDFGFDYQVNTSLGQDSTTLEGSAFEFDTDNFTYGAGNGFGADLGLRVSLSPSLSFNIGVMDIGSIRFKKGVTNMFNHSGYRYEGEALTFAQDQNIDLDSIARLAEPTYTHDAFTVPLPTKLVLTGSKGFDRVEAKSGAYYKHQVTAMYLQGFAKYLSSTTTPYLAVGYTRNFNNVLNLGANAGVGGLTGGTFGVLASVKAGAFCLGFNSNNVIPLIAPSSGRSADIAMLLGLAF